MGLKAIVPTLDDVEEQFHSLYTKRGEQFELTGVEGMRTQADVDRLQQSLTNERNAHKTTKDAWKVLGDARPEDVASQLARIPELEAAATGKLDDSKIDGIVETRLKARLGPVERERDKLKTELGEATKAIDSFKTADRTRSISDSVRTAASKLKMQDTAIEDAVMLGERVFEVTEDGAVVTRDNINGVTAGISAEAWLTDMQPKKPHWWGPSFGGGANGNRGGGNLAANPWSHEHWNMTEQGKIYQQNQSRAEQLAKQAGTTIGGGRPAAKK